MYMGLAYETLGRSTFRGDFLWALSFRVSGGKGIQHPVVLHG